MIDIANQMAPRIDAPRHLIGQHGAMYQVTGCPALVQQIGDGGDVPDHLRPAAMIAVIALDNLDQIVANRAAPGDIGFQFRNGGVQVTDDAHARNQDKRDATIKEQPRRRHILFQVKLTGVRPVQRMTAQPDDDDLFDDLRLQQHRRRDIRDRANRHDIEWIIVRACQRPLNQIARCRTLDWL